MDGAHTGAHSIRWPWIAAMWCVGGMFQASQAVLIMRFAESRRHAWLPLFAAELAAWLPWALATPWVIVGLSKFLRRAGADGVQVAVTLPLLEA